MPSSFLQLLWKNIEIDEYQNIINKLRKDLGISSIFAKILISRNLLDIEEIDNFLNPTKSQCHNPYILKDMNKAVERIYLALLRGERVVVYGDYDVDGTAATAILYKFLKKIGVRTHYFIPDRLKDGYGMTESTLRDLVNQRTNIIITVDNGSTAFDESYFLKKHGIDLLITDHHQTGSNHPENTAFINPQRKDCNYPFTGLCGAAVAYKLVEALDIFLYQQNFWDKYGSVRPDIKQYLDLVALATIADRMPLIDENRFFVKEGLDMMNSSPRPGLCALIKASNIKSEITPNLISFRLAPKINAAGRLSDSKTGIKLLLSHSLMEARIYAEELVAVNSRRQVIERQVWKSALTLANKQQNQNIIILFHDSWHPGVLGSVAAKIACKFGKPTIILTLSDCQLAVGSIRSTGNFDACLVLKNCAEFLEKYGGHKAAAGLSMMSQNVNLFCNKLKNVSDKWANKSMDQLNDALIIDAWINPEEFNYKLAEEIIQLAPFGPKNPEPILGLRNAEPKSAILFGQKHLKFRIFNDDNNIEVFAWDHHDWYYKLRGCFDLAVSPYFFNTDPSNYRIQFKAVDIKPVS